VEPAWALVGCSLLFWSDSGRERAGALTVLRGVMVLPGFTPQWTLLRTRVPSAEAYGRAVLRPVILALALIALLLTPAAATQAAVAKGFTKCSRVRVAGDSKARVVVRGVPCVVGHSVARDYYQRIYDGDSWDGRAGDGSIYYAVDGFRCGTAWVALRRSVITVGSSLT
jgi:hypothetical protein